MEIYTMEDWERDRNFNAEIGQEIAPEIYERMFECMPPLRLTNRKPTNADLGIVSGFRMSEPYAHADSPTDGKWTAFYMAFGKTTDGRCYFLGHQNKYGEIFDATTGKAIENK